VHLCVCVSVCVCERERERGRRERVRMWDGWDRVRVYLRRYKYCRSSINELVQVWVLATISILFYWCDKFFPRNSTWVLWKCSKVKKKNKNYQSLFGLALTKLIAKEITKTLLQVSWFIFLQTFFAFLPGFNYFHEKLVW